MIHLLQDYNELEMVEDVIRGFEKTLDGMCSSEESTDQDELLRVETCDKETNTVQVLGGKTRSHDTTGVHLISHH